MKYLIKTKLSLLHAAPLDCMVIMPNEDEVVEYLAISYLYAQGAVDHLCNLGNAVVKTQEIAGISHTISRYELNHNLVTGELVTEIPVEEQLEFFTKASKRFLELLANLQANTTTGK